MTDTRHDEPFSLGWLADRNGRAYALLQELLAAADAGELDAGNRTFTVEERLIDVAREWLDDHDAAKRDRDRMLELNARGFPYGVAWWAGGARHGQCNHCQQEKLVHQGYNGGQPLDVFCCWECITGFKRAHAERRTARG